MPRLLLALSVCIAISTLSLAAAPDDDQGGYWAAWWGPTGDGFAAHADPPVTWDESTHVKWKAAISGEGSATPIVWGDQVFTTTAVRTDRAVATLPPPLPII